MSEPIRVLQVVTHMNRGGLETMLMNYYRHIDRSKVQFDFLVHRFERAAYDDEIEALGGRIYRLPRLVPWGIGYNRALNNFFKEHTEYRIVHVHQDCLSAVILRSAKKHGIPVRIAHSHNANQDKDIKYIIKLFYKRFIPQYATELFACGQQAGVWMFGRKDFRILNNAIDVDCYRYDANKREEIRKELDIGPNAFVIGHVGRFSKQKNHTFLLDVFAEILKKSPEARLLLVGDGELRRDIEEKARALNIKKAIIFTGVRSDVSALMQAMDVFLFPSLYEGLSIAAIEAQAAGLPCVISNNIPTDCDLTENIYRCDLSDSPERWAQVVCKCGNLDKRDNMEQTLKAGYDINANAMWLQEYYLANDVENR